MKYIVTVYLLLSFFLGAYGQPYPEFSPLSGSQRYNFSATKADGGIFYCLRRVVGDTVARYITYKLNEEGQVTDSVAHSPDGIDRWGWISAQEERIFFHGIRWVGSVFTNIRHTVIEYDQQLEQVGETIGVSLTPSTAFIPYQSTGFVTMTQMSDFHLYNDTLLAAYQFLMVDSPLVFQGRKNFFLKTGLDGTVYVKKELPVNEMYNVFFGDGKMYVPGRCLFIGTCAGRPFFSWSPPEYLILPAFLNAIQMTYRPALFALFVFFACTQSEKSSTAAPAAAGGANLQVTTVEGYIVKPSTLSENITASGTLLSAEETELHPEASGRVTYINLPEGKTVRKGQLLLKVFDQDLKTQLQKLETQKKQAEITEQRLAELLKVKGVSQQEYDLASLQVQTLNSEMELVRINSRKTELRAPYDGIIGLRKISPGAYVTPATAITTIRAATALKLDFSVPEKYSASLRPGQTVSFTVEGNPTPHTATVLATEQNINADTRNLQVRAAVRGNSRELLPGAFAQVNLSLGNKPSALLIPSQSIIPQARDKKVIVSKGGKATFVTVKTGIRQAELVEITEGIQSGDTIAVTGMLFLRPAMPMKFSKVE